MNKPIFVIKNQKLNLNKMAYLAIYKHHGNAIIGHIIDSPIYYRCSASEMDELCKWWLSEKTNTSNSIK